MGKADPVVEDHSGEWSILTISSDYLEYRFTRGGGPGGQNVNKVSTRVTVRYAFDRDPRWDAAAVEHIRRRLVSRLSRDGRIMVTCSKHRTQRMNREEALDRLHALIETAFRRAKPRRATKPTRASQERRLTEKRRTGERKQRREMKKEE